MKYAQNNWMAVVSRNRHDGYLCDRTRRTHKECRQCGSKSNDGNTESYGRKTDGLTVRRTSQS